jgi:hypothetical protein
LLLNGCQSQPEGITRVDSENSSLEYVVFDKKLEVKSPFDSKTYIGMPLKHFDTLNMNIVRKPMFGDNVDDRKFSHARFAVVRKFPACESLREAVKHYDQSRNRPQEQYIKASVHPRTKQRYAAFYDSVEQYSNVTGEPIFWAYSATGYSDADTFAEVDKCDAKRKSMSVGELLGKRPYIIFWIYIEDDPESDRVNDIYLTRVTFAGFRDENLFKEWLRMMGDGIVEDVIGEVFSGGD